MRTHHRIGEFDAAMTDFDAAILRKADYGEASWERAVLKERLGDKAGAAADRERARSLGPLL